jgi:hypothetical protein
MGSTKMCLGIIHLLWEKDGSARGQTKEKKEAAVLLYCLQ